MNTALVFGLAKPISGLNINSTSWRNGFWKLYLCMRFKQVIFCILGILAFSSPVKADAQSLPAAQSSSLQSNSTSSAPISSSSLAPSSTSTEASEGGEPQSSSREFKIEPLGVWIRPVATPKVELKKEAEEKKSPHQQTEELQIEEERRIFEELLKRYKREQINIEAPPPLVKKIVLNKKQRKRLDRIEKIQKRKLKKQSARLNSMRRDKARGLPEIRVCTLNLDNYGEKAAVNRLVRGIAKKKFKVKEKEIVSRIVGAGCAVVAVQGVIGQSIAQAKAGLSRLAGKIEEQSQWEWTSYLGASNHQRAFNGFLVSSDNISVETTRSYRSIPLMRFGSSKKKEFPRGPFEIVLRVGNRDSSGSRRLVLMTMHFRKSLSHENSEPEEFRIQMAETLRRLIYRRQRELADEDDTIFILLGDRAGGRYTPATRILEGQLRMKHFRPGGPCRIKEVVVEQPEEKKKTKKSAKKKKKKKIKPKIEYRAECEATSKRLKTLFGIVSENVPPLMLSVRREDGKKNFVVLKPTSKARALRKKGERERTAEVYLLQDSLPYAWKYLNSPTRYDVYQKPLEYSIKKSPLLGVQLNW